MAACPAMRAPPAMPAPGMSEVPNTLGVLDLPSNVPLLPATQVRPEGQQSQQTPFDAGLDEWVNAKRVRDFELADRIREGLLRQGCDPNIYRPRDWAGWKMDRTGAAAG